MKRSSLVRAFCASVLLTLATSVAGAQSTTQSSAPAATSSSTPWAALPAGTYKLDIQLPERPLPAEVVIRDSSGVPAATFQPEGDPAQPVRITIKGVELTLNGEAPKGPFEIVLLREGDQITGRWTYAGDSGKLTGKAEK
ncbi:MAG TPA: hypothetical protein VKA54_21300 [Gemmatimonadaceae bacterium]|nr:hypothetical protein [Gemmatimonadaceae bacterium]